MAWLALGCGGHTRENYAGPSGSTFESGGSSGISGSAMSSTSGTSPAFGGAPIQISSGGALAVLPSSGCGKPLPQQQVPTITGTRTGYTEFFVDQTGATLGADVPSDAGARQFFVRVPVDYDPNHPYRIVYIGQGCGAQRSGDKNTIAFFNEGQGGSEQAVYVALSVPDNDANRGCYDNNNGAESQEWEAFDLIHRFVESTYCVDNDAIYVAGYASGGWLANMWGCYFGGTPSPPLDQPDVDAGRPARKFAPSWAIRGHATVAGALPPNQPVPCNGPSAGLWLHDQGDHGNLLAADVAALELALETNGCVGNYANGPKQPWLPAENIPELAGGVCQQYTGCPTEVLSRYPLVFCTTAGAGQRDMPQNAIPAITRFFEALDLK